jgi:hypothetical protein
MSHKGLNQLLCAALVNNRFRTELLANPPQAVRKGYLGQKFSLNPDELALVSSIRVKGIEEFAAVVYRWITSEEGGSQQDRYAIEKEIQPLEASSRGPIHLRPSVARKFPVRSAIPLAAGMD